MWYAVHDDCGLWHTADIGFTFDEEREFGVAGSADFDRVVFSNKLPYLTVTLCCPVATFVYIMLVDDQSPSMAISAPAVVCSLILTESLAVCACVAQTVIRSDKIISPIRFIVLVLMFIRC